MNALRKEDFLYAQLNCFKHRVERTKEKIREAFATGAKWSVSFSGGKDSLCVLHLVRSIDKDIPAVFIDSGTEYPETLEFVKSCPNVIIEKPTMTLLEMYETCGDYQGLDKKPELYFTSKQIVETINQEPIRHVNEQCGFTGNFTGIRKQESNDRLWLAKTKKGLWQQKDGTWRCEPVINWTHQDVWSFIASNGLPYNAVYDRLADLGVPREEWRVAPYAGSTKIRWGRWAILKRGWPDLFAQFAARFPEARAYV